MGLKSEGTLSGIKGYIALGTSFSYNEEVTSRGRVRAPSPLTPHPAPHPHAPPHRGRWAALRATSLSARVSATTRRSRPGAGYAPPHPSPSPTPPHPHTPPHRGRWAASRATSLSARVSATTRRSRPGAGYAPPHPTQPHTPTPPHTPTQGTLSGLKGYIALGKSFSYNEVTSRGRVRAPSPPTQPHTPTAHPSPPHTSPHTSTALTYNHRLDSQCVLRYYSMLLTTRYLDFSLLSASLLCVSYTIFMIIYVR